VDHQAAVRVGHGGTHLHSNSTRCRTVSPPSRQ
jgi:hypothetical protein